MNARSPGPRPGLGVGLLSLYDASRALMAGLADGWLHDPAAAYCSMLAPAMPTGMVEPSLLKKIVPRESVPNYRWPVEPTAAGCASAKYDETASRAAGLQVEAATVTVDALASGSRLTT
jgi:hypothetical protein